MRNSSSNNNIKMLKYLSILLYSSLIVSMATCSNSNDEEKWKHVELYPLDSSQVVTVLTKGDYRYFLNGRQSSSELRSFLKLGMSNVDKLGDGISICWSDNGYGWEVSSSYAVFVETTLDTAHFKFAADHSVLKKSQFSRYDKASCGGVLIRENIGPGGNLLLKYPDNAFEH